MLTKLISKTSTFASSKLNCAIALSVAAMLSFNIVVLASQLQAAPQVAQTPGTAAQQV